MYRKIYLDMTQNEFFYNFMTQEYRFVCCKNLYNGAYVMWYDMTLFLVFKFKTFK